MQRVGRVTADFLLELRCEEIPARMQAGARNELAQMLARELDALGVAAAAIDVWSTPRRLALVARGLPAETEASREEIKGPRAGAPQQAVDGFLKAAGLASIDEAKIESDPKKGEFYVAHIEKKGAEAETILAGLLPKIITDFQWPKSMQWGHGGLTWVRPLRAITANPGHDWQLFMA